METPPFHPPVRGDLVGGYRVVAPLGVGGYGYVYKVERAGFPFSLKLLRARALDDRGQREINILRHVKHRNVVRFHACDRWPHPLHGYLFFVMDFIEGRTLEAWALDENPCARCIARVLLEIVRALADIHAQGVLHRDLKLENILIRDGDGVPILVDFGVGWLAGEPPLTRGTLPPGTDEYRSPEALRFAREHANEAARYTSGVGDELWALGVIFYWLLTDELPFGTRQHLGVLNERILTSRPKAPREVNPRVPQALSDVCMRMLRKEREARFATCEELAEALEAALAAAGPDGSWDVPLMDPEAPDVAPTEEDPELVPRDAEEREAHRWNVSRPRRGRKAARKPGPAREEERPPEVSAPALVKAPEAPVRAEVAGAPVAMKAPRPVARSLVPLGVLMLAGAGLWTLQDHPAPVASPAPTPTEMAVSPPAGWLASNPTLHAYLFRELAVSSESSESGGGAVHFLPPTPAPGSATMLRKKNARLKSEEKPAPRPQRKAPGCVPTTQETCVAGICTLLLTGCTGTPQVVRPPPQPADCPPGALETMKELGIDIGKRAGVTFPVVKDSKPVTVRESTPVTLRDHMGRLKAGTELSGRLYLGAERIYGRFTQAKTLGGKTYPVCMELLHHDTRTRDVERKDVGGPADSAVVFSTQDVRAVDHFE